MKVEKSNVDRLESLSKARRKTFKFLFFDIFFERFSAEALEFTEEEQTSSEKVEKSFWYNTESTEKYSRLNK